MDVSAYTSVFAGFGAGRQHNRVYLRKSMRGTILDKEAVSQALW